MSRTTHSPELLEFARGLVAYDAAFNSTEQPVNGTGFRVCDKLRQPLTRLAGVTGFRMLLARALTLAKARASGMNQSQLNTLHLKPDGSFEFVTNNGDPLPSSSNDAALILTAELLALLVAFVGEVFTLSLVRDVWPGFPVLETELWRNTNRDDPEKS